jgi:hypothetical protein
MPTRKNKQDINEMLLEAHKRGIEQAIDLSIRTGVPLVVEKDGKIKEVKPEYKYIRVPITTDKKERPKK